MIPLLEEKKGDSGGYSELLKKIKEIKSDNNVNIDKNYDFNLDSFDENGKIKK